VSIELRRDARLPDRIECGVDAVAQAQHAECKCQPRHQRLNVVPVRSKNDRLILSGARSSEVQSPKQNALCRWTFRPGGITHDSGIWPPHRKRITKEGTQRRDVVLQHHLQVDFTRIRLPLKLPLRSARVAEFTYIWTAED